MKKTSFFRLLVVSLFVFASTSCGSSSSLLSQGSTLLSTLGGNPDLSTFTSLLKTPGIDKLLGSSLKGPVTLLAPTNEAFNSLPASTLTDLKNPANTTQIANLLKNGIIPGKVDPSMLKDGVKTSASGSPINLSGVNPGSLITSGDVNIIPIDKVLQ